VYSTVDSALVFMLGFTAIARMIVAAVKGMGVVYRVDAADGSLPSVV